MLVLLALLLPASASAATLVDARQHYEDGEYVEAYEIWRALARDGNGEAAFNIAALYFNGQGLSRSESAAYEWMRTAAEAGYRPAMEKLSDMYREGVGTVARSDRALQWRVRLESPPSPVTASPKPSAFESMSDESKQTYTLTASRIANLLALLDDFNQFKEAVKSFWSDGFRPAHAEEASGRLISIVERLLNELSTTDGIKISDLVEALAGELPKHFTPSQSAELSKHASVAHSRVTASGPSIFNPPASVGANRTTSAAQDSSQSAGPVANEGQSNRPSASPTNDPSECLVGRWEGTICGGTQKRILTFSGGPSGVGTFEDVDCTRICTRRFTFNYSPAGASAKRVEYTDGEICGSARIPNGGVQTYSCSGDSATWGMPLRRVR
mgnify:CR=1 FL=1